MIFYLGTFNSHDTHHWIRLTLKIILLSFKTWFVFSNKVKKIISDYPFHSRNQKTRKKSYLVDKDSAVLVCVLVCQQVDLQGCGGGSLAIVGAGWTTIVPGVDSSDEIVVGLHLDIHHSGPAGGAHTGTEDRVHPLPLSSCLHTVRQVTRTSRPGHQQQQQHL